MDCPLILRQLGRPRTSGSGIAGIRDRAPGGGHRYLACLRPTVLLLAQAHMGDGQTNAARKGAADEESLHLVRTAAFPIPSQFRVSGGAFGSDGSVLVWSRDEGGVLALRNGTTTRLCRSARPIAAAATAAGVVQIIDKEGATYSSTDKGPCRRDSGPLRSLFPQYAVHGRDGWILAAMDADAHQALFHARASRLTPFADSAALSDLRLRQAVMTNSDSGVIVANMVWPFTWRVINGATPPFLPARRPFARDSVIATERDTVRLAEMLSLGVHPTDAGFLQVLSDPRSDLRLLVLYDRAAHVTRMRTIGGPFGILATRTDTQDLLALQRTDGLEIIRYKWSWLAPTLPTQRGQLR